MSGTHPTRIPSASFSQWKNKAFENALGRFTYPDVPVVRSRKELKRFPFDGLHIDEDEFAACDME